MKVKGKMKKDLLAVSIEGRVDMESCAQLEKFIEENAQGAETVEFDFRKVEYISSAGLRVLLKLRKRYDSDSHVIIRNVSDQVRLIFELTGFTNAVTIM